ncbi:hypothetical protein SAMN05216389_1084 [Oceanobacillus limi]|uniref:Uncharacterized protein n=1 Tax=Oceanobacillus limi TaxID=930131 RepID=A0A1I0D545_9BACI|nr:hypothetical protein SAMN05216389_1084 [Oceanobacillus limi]
MRYEPDQEELFLNEYIKENAQFHSLSYLQDQVHIYRNLELVTLVIIDTHRYLDDIKTKDFTQEEHHEYAYRYLTKLKKVWSMFGMQEDTMTLDQIKEIFSSIAKVN